MVKEFSSEADKTLIENSNELEKGIWKAHASLMVFYKKGYKKQSSVEVKDSYYSRLIYQDIDRSTRLAFLLFSIFYKKKIGKNGFNGQILLLSSAKATTRVVNIKKNLLLTKYRNSSAMEQRGKKWKNWNSYFKTISPIEIDNEKCYTIEPYIMKKSCTDDKKFSHILEDYSKSSKKMKYKVKHKTFSKQEKQKILSKCKTVKLEDAGKKAIDWLESNNYRTSLSHGDMSPLNVIYDGKDYYYIDFECVSERLFFYDLIGYIFWCGHNNKNYKLISSFLDGAYDTVFTEIFSNYDITYNPKDKLTYIMVYAIECGWVDMKAGFYNNLFKLCTEYLSNKQ